MIDFVKKYGRNFMFSQNGEEGILQECRERMIFHVKNHGHAVEIGANNGLFCSNTARLLTHGWSGVMVEADHALYLECLKNWEDNDPRPSVQCSKVDGNNINAFVDDRCDVLSVDVDGADFEIFQGLKARPAIVIVEVDSSIPPESDERNADGAVGYGPMLRLGIEKGYFLLCHTGNLILLRNDFRHLFPEIIGDGISNAELYFNQGWLKEAAA